MSESTWKTGVLILHPHPLYGGDMYNPVVTGLERVFLDEGFTTLRFNFRGALTPGYAGIEGAVLDATNALNLLTSRGVEKVGLAGYSFGGSTALRLASVSSPLFLVTLSASKALVEEGGFELDNLSNVVCPTLMFHGDMDQMVPYEDLRVLSSRIGTETVETILLEGESHFYQRHLSDVLRTVRSFVTQ
ncbi:MAG: alpha/beta hydrolase [Candidatus Thorarchaeota archaeon]